MSSTVFAEYLKIPDFSEKMAEQSIFSIEIKQSTNTPTENFTRR
jgi:hypothetical protein